MKTGILGGTFDPVHNGHVLIAEVARDALGLDEVLLVPAGQPVFKAGDDITPPEDRLAMVRLAAEGRDRLRVSDMEICRDGPSYTVDTIASLREQYAAGDEMYFILGWDSLMQLPEWREPARIIGMCRLAAVYRPGCERPDPEELEERVPGIFGRLVWLEEPRIDINSSDIREMVAGGESIDHLVPAQVATYMREHRLYKHTGR